MKNMRVFLGGTVNGSQWREELIPQLRMDFFNPVVPTWTEEAYENELREREECDICLYVITPKFEGLYSIAEVADDSNKRPERTVFCLLHEDEGKHFSPTELKSLRKVGTLVANNGAHFVEGMPELVKYLKSKEKRAVRALT